MDAPIRWSASSAPVRAGATLLCLPYAGGDGAPYRSWAAALGPGIQVGWAELPGRGNYFSLPPLRRIDEQVRWLLPALRDIAPPLAIFGYSMGALTGFELAHALRDAGAAAPVLLAVAAHHAPGRPVRHQPLHALPEDEFVRRLASFEGTPVEVLANTELLALLTPRLRADFEACETYRPDRSSERASLDVPLVAYGGASDREVPPEALLHWAPLTRGRFDCMIFSGHHFFIQEQSAALLHDLTSRLLHSLRR